MTPATLAPWSLLVGGALVGLGASVLVLAIGRIASVSGIVAGLLDADRVGGRPWRLAFVAGVVLAPVITCTRVSADAVGSPSALVLGGVLVGAGAHYASGCTSAHGVSGLAHFSRRSLAATATFTAAAITTVFVMRHALGASP